ncbi:hypothetical protein GPALN_001833 [Globodera pallida]|nr:hypothetical protein GPALN_001833 [Globodera pallida]
MPSGAVEWPSQAIAEPILHWIGIARPANPAHAHALHDALHNSSADLPSLSSLGFLFDVYMPSQPDLLFALFLLGALTAGCILLLLIVLFVLCTSRRGTSFIKCSSSKTEGGARTSTTPSTASGVDAFSTDGKPHGPIRCQRALLLAVCMSLWACLVLACALYACALGELASASTAVGPGTAVTGPPEHTADELRDDDVPPGRRIGRHNKDAAAELLRKFEDVRELGYQFHALLMPSVPTLFLIFFVFIFYLTTLVLCLFATLIGMNQSPRLYLPSGDHLAASAKTHAASALGGRRARVRRTLASAAIALLCAAPLMLALGGALLVQAHAHLALCGQEQQTAQDLAIAHYVSGHFANDQSAGSADAAIIALPEFLADLKAERIGVNAENCRAEVAPLNTLWLTLYLLALASMPFCLVLLALLITANCWENADDGGISLRAYLPGWNSTISPDAYKSLPVSGGQYQHYSISSRHGLQPPGDASQSSFGTFVYKKY